MNPQPLSTPASTSPLYDYKRYAVLYVDDEEKSLKYFTRAFQDQFRIFTAPNAQEGFKLLQQHKDEIGLLMSDQRMPGEKGVWLLEKARQLCPRVIRILATAYSDMDAAIAAVNTGAIYKYVGKPWDPPQLEITLKRGLEFFMVQRERDDLLREKMTVLQHMMIADRIVSLGLLAAGLSHHIRNSLVAVKTFLDLAPTKLQEENIDFNSLRNPDFWREYYQNVQGQIEKINNMLKDLWVASKAPAYQFADPVKLPEVINKVVQDFGAHLQAKNIRIHCAIPEDLPGLVVDQPKFYRLFELLIRDELTALPSGCEIQLSAKLLPGETPDLSRIEFELRDNGPGMPKEALRLLFDPFMSRQNNPIEYGINLMACYLIVHHHGGEISANSEQGKGTTFTLRLPVNPNEPGVLEEDQQNLQKILLNDALWEKLLVAA